MAKKMIPKYMTTLQFIVSASTVLVRGKKAKTNTGSKNMRATILTAMPQFPSFPATVR